jgi:hypothetical protein
MATDRQTACRTQARARTGIFEQMHYVCFHYEFEHDAFDPDEECTAGGRPSFKLDAPPRQLRDADD